MADADTRPARQRLADKIDINMTPMIDIVFQLLAFFIMTLKIVQPEGDFDVRMPLGAAAAAAPRRPVPPLERARGLPGTPIGRAAAAAATTVRAATAAASVPACPPPTTMMSKSVVIGRA